MADTSAEPVSEILAAHYDEMMQKARSVLRSEVDAEDAVQDAMVSVLQAPHVLGVVNRAGSWLLALVYRRCVDLIRRETRRRDMEAQGALEDLFEGADADELMQEEEVMKVVAGAVKSLPPELRSAFVHNALEGRAFREMSEESDVPMGTLMARKKKATDLVRKELRKRGLIG